MPRRRCVVWAVVLPPVLSVAVLLSTTRLSAEPPGGDVRIASLIHQLGSADYIERTQANENLAEVGSAARAQLEAAARDQDAEIRLRAKELLARLKVQELWSASPLCMEAGTMTVSKLFNSLGTLSGNRILMGDQYGSFHEQDIACAAEGATFWQWIDDVCKRSGNRVRPHYDTRQPGLVVIAGAATKFPVAYAGPVRAQITTARRVFTEELDYENLSSELSHTFQLGVQMMWEDRFRLVAYRSQPDLVAAVADNGLRLAASQSSGNGWNVAGSGTRQLTTSLRLQPPSTAAKELDTLELKWGLIAVGDMVSLDVTNLTSTEPHFQDDVELVVESMTQGPGARCELTVSVLRELVIPEPQDVLFQENEIELIDAQGRPYRKQGQSNSLSETGAKMKVTFLGESSDSVPRTLKFIYPRIRSERELSIVFRHVPLPVGKPE